MDTVAYLTFQSFNFLKHPYIMLKRASDVFVQGCGGISSL